MLKKINVGFVFFLFPILDLISNINSVCYAIALGWKGFLLLTTILFLLKRKENHKVFAFIGLFFLLSISYIFKSHLHFGIELSYLITLFSLPTLILFFNQYENDFLNKKNMTIVSTLYFVFFIISAIFHFPLNYSFVYVLLLTFSLSFLYLVESRSYLLKILFGLFLVISSFYIQAKTFYLSILLLIILFVILNSKKVLKFCQNNFFKTLLILLVFSLGVFFYLPKVHLEEIIPLKYTSLNELLNGRINQLQVVKENYLESSGLQKLLGLGVENTTRIGIDALDIFYSIGIIGCLFYILYFAYVLYKSPLKKNYAFVFTFFLLLSCLGNVLFNPYLIFFMALLFQLSKNDQGLMKKDILLVSNMYPDSKNPHYGVFVKNTYDLLVENNYSVDLVTMNKTIGKWNKFIQYVRMCGLSLLKAIFLNYDSIYVHFASHTPAGVFIPKLFSRDTKLVLNVHGNDVVFDTKTDQNYQLLTKLFLKASDIIIAPSNYFKKVLIKDYSIDKTKIVVYPSGGVNTDVFKKINKRTALQKASLDSKYKYFGFVGRIDQDKGYDTYIKAISELKKSKKLDKNIRFILVGNGKEEEILANLMKKYKVEKLIVRKPMQSQEDLVNIYNALEAFVYPTRMKSESLGLVGLEAMACSTLVIGPNKYGPSDYLTDENSLLFSPNDYKELAAKMLEVLNMKAATKKKLIANSLQTVAKYTSENTKEILLNVFKTNA